MNQRKLFSYVLTDAVINKSSIDENWFNKLSLISYDVSNPQYWLESMLRSSDEEWLLQCNWLISYLCNEIGRKKKVSLWKSGNLVTLLQEYFYSVYKSYGDFLISAYMWHKAESKADPDRKHYLVVIVLVKQAFKIIALAILFMSNQKNNHIWNFYTLMTFLISFSFLWDLVGIISFCIFTWPKDSILFGLSRFSGHRQRWSVVHSVSQSSEIRYTRLGDHAFFHRQIFR